jgi:dipeptidyl aminopeptidase/acylaminoacyl peptidase
LVCTSQFLRQVGWARGGRSVWFLKAESSLGRPDGAPADETGLYEWDLPSNQVHAVYRGAASLSDCHVHGGVAFCVRQDATTPGRIVRIDLDTGASKILADANPAFSRRRPPQVSEIVLKDPDGNFGFARLVYPNDYQPGRRYPLVITQYRSRGFLRGGTGDEYPILPLAAEGFMVLDVNEPNDWDRMKTMASGPYQTWRLLNLRERKNIFAATNAAIDGLIARGLVDPGRIAITGLSAGAENVHFALQHSTRFAAAIASSGNHDVSWIAELPAGQRAWAESVYSNEGVVAAPGSITAQLAWSPAPDSLKTPLLINVGQYETMFGFEGIAALQDAGRPIEVRIFPDQGMHMKVDPQSRAGVYENNVMWLKFWLEGVEDPRPAFRAQYARWERMRGDLTANHAGASLR